MAVKRIGARVGSVCRDVYGLDTGQWPGEGWVICRHTRTWQPPMDIYEDDDGVVIRVEVAGVHSEDFSISLVDCMLVVAGTRVDPAPKRTYHQMEICFGEFRAEVYLPWQIRPEDVEASYEEGFLTVRLPCPESRRVPVVEADQEEDEEVDVE